MMGRVFCLFVWIFHFAIFQHQRQASGQRNSLRSMSSSSESTTWAPDDSFTFNIPTTPIPDNAECYVQLPPVRVGGRCVRLGRVFHRRRGRGRARGAGRGRSSMAWGCQSGIHLDIRTPDCNIHAARQDSQRHG